MILCQVTKNPIGAKGGRLTQEVSLPGRFVVLIPDSRTYGISKRLPEGERRRLRGILDRIKPEQHGIIVRTAAENATEHELTTDLTRLIEQWDSIRKQAEKASTPSLLYREPPLAVRVIREEFSSDYRGIVIDDPQLYAEVRDYISAFNPEFADRVELFDAAKEGLPLFEAQGLTPFVPRWQALHAYAGEAVDLIDRGRLMQQGIARGIDDMGCLLLDTRAGRIAVLAGDVSLRKQTPPETSHALAD
jgi:Rne/Rng family ribonuclease